MAEADEAAVPVHIGFLAGDSEVLEADGAAEGVEDAGEFRCGSLGTGGSGDGLERGCSSHAGELGADLDRFASKSPVVGLQGFGLIGGPLPVKGSRPWDSEDIASQDAGGIDGLAELPVGEGMERPSAVNQARVRSAELWPCALVHASAQRTSSRGRRGGWTPSRAGAGTAGARD